MSEPNSFDRIRFNRPSIVGDELAYVRDSIESGHTSAGGPYSAKAAALVREHIGAEEALLTTSCTSALELSALMLDLEPGDTVVVPSFTFTATGLAFARQGARLIFCDIEERTLGLDPEHLASLLDESVRAVVVVHYAGVACDIEGVRKVLSQWPEISLIEDNAHGYLGTWRGEALGTLGRFATQSFHETKNIVCGEGGALLLNDPADIDRARILYDKGTNRRAFMLGQVDKYSWKDTGSSFGMSDTLAAYLLAQLEHATEIQAARRRIHQWYEDRLGPDADELGITIADPPPDRGSAYHMFYVLLDDKPTRDRVLGEMHDAGVNAVFHYVPLHDSDGGRKFAARETDCPVTVDISGRLLRLPFYNDLSEAEVDRVVDVFRTAVLAGSAR